MKEILTLVGFSKCLLVFCLQIELSSAHAQTNDFFFERLDAEKGLSQASANATTQDKDGFIWVATQDGLNRFDGYRFSVYRNDHHKAIPSNFIQHVATDSSGNLWIATNNGVCIKRHSDGKIIPVRIFLNFPSAFDSIPLYKMLFTSGDDHWFLSFKKELWHWNKRKNELTLCFREETFRRKVWDIINDNKGGIYFCVENLVMAPSKSMQNSTTIWKLPVSHAEIRALAFDGKYLFAGTFRDGLFKYDLGNSSVEAHLFNEKDPHSIISNNINRLLVDNDGILWIGTREGLSLLPPGQKRFTRLKNVISNKYSLPKNFVLSFFRDRQQNVWVGLSGGGCCKYDPSRQKFGIFQKDMFLDNSLSDNMVFNILGSDRYIFFATQSGGLSVYNRKRKTFANYFSIEGKRNTILHNNIYGFTRDEQGNLWMATWGGLSMFNAGKEPGSFINYADRSNQKTNFYSIHKIKKQNRLLVSGVNGLFIFDIDKKSWLPSEWTIPPSLQTVTLRTIYERNDYQFWMGGVNTGLIYFNLLSGEYTLFNSDSLLQKSTIRKILPGENGELWLGTDKGLLLFDTTNLKITRSWQTQDGLPNNVVYSMEFDAVGRLWISTNTGISVFDRHKNSFRNFDISDGLQANEFNTSSSFRDADGTLYFGGINGVSYFKPDSLTTSKTIPEVFITSIKLFNEELKMDTVPEKKKVIELDYHQNFLSFEFVAVNYSQSEKNKYAWKMEGLETNWNYSGSRNFTTYTDIKPGSYHLKIKAAGTDGQWSDQYTSLLIIIRYPFWNTWWFYLCGAFLLSGLIYILFRYRIDQLKKVIEVRTKISRDLHDEVGATLSGIAMYSHLARQQVRKEHDPEVEKSLDVIQNSAVEMVNKLSDIVWVVNPQQDSLRKLVEKLDEYATSIAGVKNILVKVVVPDKIAEIKLPMASRRDIYLICKEAINNAVKYSNASRLELLVRAVDQGIEFSVLDNGQGFNPAGVKRGNGLENMQKRADEIRAKLKIESKPDQGSLVSIWVNAVGHR